MQVCSKDLLTFVGMEDRLEGRKELIAGINHMAWLLEIRDRDGNDLYPEIKSRVAAKIADPEFKDKSVLTISVISATIVLSPVNTTQSTTAFI